jgi:hypothetical protein
LLLTGKAKACCRISPLLSRFKRKSDRTADINTKMNAYA